MAVQPTRLTQPYRKGARAPSLVLAAMQKGRTAGGFNPQDIARQAQTLTSASKRMQRRPRPPRPQRPPR